MLVNHCDPCVSFCGTALVLSSGVLLACYLATARPDDTLAGLAKMLAIAAFLSAGPFFYLALMNALQASSAAHPLFSLGLGAIQVSIDVRTIVGITREHWHARF